MFDPAPDLWLATRLLKSLAARPDLRLTGRDLAQGIAAPRFTVPADVLRIAATPTGRTRVYLDLDLDLAGDAARISYSFEAARPDLPSDVELMAVRVEAIRVQADAPRTVTRAPEPPRTWLRGNAGISAAERAKWTAPPATTTAAAPPPKLSDMPARWTLLEALARIMFRDTGTVQDASLEMPREATAYWAEARLPGGNGELVPVMGEPGSGRLRLSAEWAYDRAQGTPPNGLASDAAENDLLAKLRSSAIVARGRLTTDATPRAMDPGDWRGLALVERTRGDVAAEPQGATGQAWWEISVARDDVVREWPPHAEVPAAAPCHVPDITRTGTAGRATSMHLIHPEQPPALRLARRIRRSVLRRDTSPTGLLTLTPMRQRRPRKR